jgi:hypothetical protein
MRRDVSTQLSLPATSWESRLGRNWRAASLSAAHRVYAEHRVLLALSIGYIAAGGFVLTLLHRPWPILHTAPWFLIAWTAASAAWLRWQYVRSPERLWATLSPPRVFGALLVALLVTPTQITFQSLKQSIGPLIGFHADPWLHRLDVLVHGRMAWLWFQPLLSDWLLVRTIDLLYMGWFVGLFAFLFWASWTSHRRLRLQALIAFVLIWISAGNVAAALLPSAGPCYYAQVVGGSDPYAALLSQLDSLGSSHDELAARLNQQGVWQLFGSDAWGYFGGISAMPSLHVGISVLFALVAWRRSRGVGAMLWLYACVIQIGSVVLAWHYAVDGYFGAVLAVVSWKVALALVPQTHDLERLATAG